MEPIDVPTLGEPPLSGFTDGQLDAVIGGTLIASQSLSKAMAIHIYHLRKELNIARENLTVSEDLAFTWKQIAEKSVSSLRDIVASLSAEMPYARKE